MTRAMNATKLPAGPKVLRIGVMQGTRMTEERILRDRSAVTVGTTEHNTFVVASAELPPRAELFSVADGQYILHLTDAMEGQFAMPDGVRKLSDLRRSPATQRTADGYRVAVPDTARGKIHLGSVVFLFQFVAAPPVMPRPQLPAALRSRWVKNVDWTYNSCFSAFLALAIGSVAYVEYAYDPIVDDDLAMDDARLVRLLAMPAPTVEPAPDAAPDDPTTEASAAPTPDRPAPATTRAPRPTAADRAADRAAADQRRVDAANAAADRAVQAVANVTRSSAEFAALTGVNETGRGNARDALAEGGLMTGTRDDLAHASGIAPATGRVGVQRGAIANPGGPPGGRQLGEATLVRSTGDQIGTGPEVVRARVIVIRTEPGEIVERDGEGTVDPSSVARIIRGQLGGIRSCYERELRNNPTLAGRLNVSFTIGTSGRITTASTSGLPAAPAVGTCVTGRLRGLVFPVPEGGSVGFDFPFTFTPGG
jgi:hypothetical protein